MKLPFRKVHLYNLLVISISFGLYYLFRNRLTSGFVGIFVNDLHWLPPNWIYNELVVGLFGIEACFNGWVFSRVHGWRHKSKDTPKELIELSPKIDTLNTNIKSLNENVWNLFKYFNPVLERNGLRFELDEVGAITLREAAVQVEQKRKAIAEEKRKLQDLENIELTA